MMNALIITLVSVVTIFLSLFLGAQLKLFTLSDPNRINGVGEDTGQIFTLGSTDGLVILAILIFLIILIPTVVHFRLVNLGKNK